MADAVVVPGPVEHEEYCRPGDRCVECDGCDCGVDERYCAGPGCYSVDARDQWRFEMGYDEVDL